MTVDGHGRHAATEEAGPGEVHPLRDESGEVVYESSLISVSQDVKTVTG